MSDYSAAAKLLKEHDNFVILTHDFPDADGIGAAYALYTILEKMGKTVQVCIPSSGINRFGFLDRRKIFHASPVLENPVNCVPIILDTNEKGNLDPYAECLLESAQSYMVIDHHEIPSDNRPGKQRLIALRDSNRAATCEIIYLLAKELSVPIETDAAQALFTGIVFDTGSFAYQKTSAETFRIGSELLEAGASPVAAHEMMNWNRSQAALLLRKMVLSTLEFHADNRIAVQHMKQSMLEITGALYEEAEEFINTPLESRDVEISVLFKENSLGVMRCSLRSKKAVNVAQFAQQFGGGGHKRAAGFVCKPPYSVMKEHILSTLTTLLRTSL